jgi:hypothetical protein
MDAKWQHEVGELLGVRDQARPDVGQALVGVVLAIGEELTRQDRREDVAELAEGGVTLSWVISSTAGRPMPSAHQAARPSVETLRVTVGGPIGRARGAVRPRGRARADRCVGLWVDDGQLDGAGQRMAGLVTAYVVQVDEVVAGEVSAEPRVGLASARGHHQAVIAFVIVDTGAANHEESGRCCGDRDVAGYDRLGEPGDGGALRPHDVAETEYRLEPGLYELVA